MPDSPDTAASDPAPAEPAATDAPSTESQASVEQAAPAPDKIKTLPKENPYYWGTGRRKAAVARVRIRPGTGKFIVNKREVDTFFCIDKDRKAVRTPLNVSGTTKAVDVFVNVGGGGISGQAGAVVLGLARALVKANADYEPLLRAKRLLRRDPRRVERKKYGQRGARRRFQFSKR